MKLRMKIKKNIMLKIRIQIKKINSKKITKIVITMIITTIFIK